MHSASACMQVAKQGNKQALVTCTRLFYNTQAQPCLYNDYAWYVCSTKTSDRNDTPRA